MTSMPPEHSNLRRSASLNARQEAFCEHYEEEPNAAAAARRAGYSSHSARSQGSRLLADGNIQQHIATLKKIRMRARALDRELLLERLEDLYHAAMAEGRLNAAIQALRLMAQIGGHTSRAAQEEYAEEYGEAELADAQPLGPLQRAARHGEARRMSSAADREVADAETEAEAEAVALIQNARQTLARTRPDQLPKGRIRARLFMVTASGDPTGAGVRRRRSAKPDRLQIGDNVAQVPDAAGGAHQAIGHAPGVGDSPPSAVAAAAKS